MMTSPFEFSDSLDNTAPENRFVLRVPAGIRSKSELLDALARVGRFPDYFGRNWDALSDCLRDFGWIAEKHIVIMHSDVPLRANPVDCRIYFKILCEAIDDWNGTASRPTGAACVSMFLDHELRVLFPGSEQSTVADMLRS